MAAYRRDSGERAWAALSGPAGYSSPLAVEIAGERQYVFSRGAEIISLSTDGNVLWRRPAERRGAIPMPLFLPPDRIFTSTVDDGFGGQMLRIVKDENGFRAEEDWSVRLMRNHMSTSVLVGEHLYGFDKATLKCLDSATGELAWARRGFGQGSVVAAGDRLFVLGDDGTLALVKADPESYQELGRIDAMEGRAWTAPTIAGGRIFVRDADEIAAFDISEPATTTAEEATR